ncbi:MAG: hypothetical protein JWP67_2533 [Mucilaginibacter sp.]|nr:hypothetical protein [Mucilaginibacter sp.]
MKVFFRTIHLYLSFAAGLVILCSCITGTILVFEKEINHILHPQRYYVKPQDNRLPLADLTNLALKQVPKAKLASIMVYNNPQRSVEIGAILPEKKGKGDKQKAGPPKETGNAGGKDKSKGKEGEKATTVLYVNPYTGQVIEQFSKKQSFLFTVEMLHRFLLAGKNSAGDMIVGVSSLFFLFILITGVILWWPKTKNIMRQRLKIKFDGSGKRLTHDLHIVTGFYTSIFLIIIVLTGLVMSFGWANKALYVITGSEQQKEQSKIPESAYQAGLIPISIEVALKNVAGKINASETYSIRTPRDSAGTFNISILQKGAMESASDSYSIDQYNSKIVATQLFADKSLGQRIRAYVKPVHTGSIYGIPTKIISFIVCLLACIFPVTGVMMWLNRMGKKKTRIRKRRPTKRKLAIE